MSNLTIILPSFNHGAFLQERLNSIVNQSYTDWEIIIIDDCSTDDSVVILLEFVKEHKPKVRHFIMNESNSGSGYLSWQKGIELAKTEYIWIAETDDYSEPTFLEEMILILDKNKAIPFVFCTSNYVEDNIVIYDSTNRTKDLNVGKDNFKEIKGKQLLDKMPFDTYITNGSAVVFRNSYKALPNELFNNKQASDLFLWSYLVQNKSFVFLNKNLNYFRRHSESTTTKMNLSSIKIIFKEKIKYLNYFNETYKHQLLIDNYIRDYVWINKKELFSYKFLKDLNNVNGVTFKYFSSIFKFTFSKIKNKFL